jgi:hypothetical protein
MRADRGECVPLGSSPHHGEQQPEESAEGEPERQPWSEEEPAQYRRRSSRDRDHRNGVGGRRHTGRARCHGGADTGRRRQKGGAGRGGAARDEREDRQRQHQDDEHDRRAEA